MKSLPILYDIWYKGARAMIIGMIRIYQRTISPDHSALFLVSPRFGCRFFPSCSEYTVRAIRQYGLLTGGMVSLKRIVRCHPWNEGGYDPVPNNH